MPTKKPAVVLEDDDKRDAPRRAALRKILDRLDDICYQEAKNPPDKPLLRRWLMLALDLKISGHTVEHWARLGRIPAPMAKAIETRFGRAKVKYEDLI